jgi:hypothetical protein
MDFPSEVVCSAGIYGFREDRPIFRTLAEEGAPSSAWQLVMLVFVGQTFRRRPLQNSLPRPPATS